MKDGARIRGTTPEIEQAARQLRQQLTSAEAKLWSALRGRQLKGIKFRCQHPIGRFIVDFYCPAYKLVIEVDGDSHTQQADYDRARTEHLQQFGYRVLRFTNQAVMRELPQVLQQIAQFTESEVSPRIDTNGEINI
ncbi:MAG: endonuclease domain-containing protein [Leptolyngbyaceae cyanobacterium]